MNDTEDRLSYAAYRCPNCDYDLRGLSEARCPECGGVFNSRDVEAYLERRWPSQQYFRILILATIPWFIAYIFADVIHDTTDRIPLSWMIPLLPFLFFPLHLILACTAISALEIKSLRSKKRFGARLTIILWILILGHALITVWSL